MTATTTPLPLPRFQASGIPSWRMCHWYRKQASFGKALPGAAVWHSASMDAFEPGPAASSSWASSSGGMLASES